MGDFLLDCRPVAERRMDQAESFLRFFPDMRVQRLDSPEFSLVVTSPDEPSLWGGFLSPDGRLRIWVCGRLSLKESDWRAAEAVPGEGGLACKHLARLYRQGGIETLRSLSGNFVVLVCDRDLRQLWVLTDPWGIMPVFHWTRDAGPVIGSHPDAIADVAGETGNWDLTSLAEFILTCRLTAPHTYYARIKALPCGSVTAVDLASTSPGRMATRQYFSFPPASSSRPESEEELAEQMAVGFREAVERRSLPRLGRSAVALSGGLDSRVVLCSAPRPQELLTFSCYDGENPEFRTARSIARAVGVEFVPLQRAPDYYAEHAELGARISAGMGCIASNHFLGIRPKLAQLGVANLLTGCYCDYVLKGLGYNKQVNPWTTSESVGRFDFAYYAGHWRSGTELAQSVRGRLEETFPAELRRYDTESRIVEVERRRVFPLAFEEDSAQRSIPQRVMGWSVPIAERSLLDVYLKMGSLHKLNRRLFAKMVQRVCRSEVLAIPDANTGMAVGVQMWREACSVHLRRAGQWLRRFKPSNQTAGSWLNWSYYVNHSDRLQALWRTSNPEADDVFQRVLGPEDYSRDTRDYSGRRLSVFLQLFTLKLWLDQRCRRNVL